MIIVARGIMRLSLDGSGKLPCTVCWLQVSCDAHEHCKEEERQAWKILQNKSACVGQEKTAKDQHPSMKHP